MHVVRLGLRLEGHGNGAPRPPDGPFVVGYLARICPEKGLHLAAEAFVRLAARAGPERVRLAIAGYLGERDRAYKAEVLRALGERGLSARVDDVGEVDFAGKVAFLRGLDVLSVPTVYREPKGLFALEALANGVPVVLPRHGAFPELVLGTGGGLLHDPGDPESIARELARMLDDPAARAHFAAAGREAVRRDWSDAAAARATLKLYGSFVQNGRPG
jgi:glycosyltransferase involved in cell wall biosynthesis